MRKNLSIVTILLTIALSVNAQEVYRSEANAFMITLPAGWSAEPGQSAMVDIIARSPESPNISINVVVRESTVFDSLNIESAVDERFKNSIIDQYTKQFTNFVLLENGFTDVGSYRAFYIKYSCAMPEGGLFMAKQYFLINTSKLFIISTGSPEPVYSVHEPTFNEIVNSLKFIL